MPGKLPGSGPMALRSPEITAVVFDIGGVLLDWDPRYLYRRLLTDEREVERFLAEVCTPEWHAAHDRGVGYDDNAAELIERFPQYELLVRAWGQRGEEMERGEIQGTVAVLRELLDRGITVYALTNMERDTYARRRERYPWMSWFAGTVVSSHEGVVKPEPEIFRRLLSRFSLEAERTVMIDDSERNLVTAAGLGMVPLRFRSPEGLWRELAGIGMLDGSNADAS